MSALNITSAPVEQYVENQLTSNLKNQTGEDEDDETTIRMLIENNGMERSRNSIDNINMNNNNNNNNDININLNDGPPPLKKSMSSIQSGVETVSGAVVNSTGNVVYQLMYPSMQMPPTAIPVTNHIYSRPITPVLPIPDGLPQGQCIPVTCGNCTGKMHLNLFMCPGIHQPCIEFEGLLLSPKQFTIRGEKEKQKDWKASIRIGKSSLRAHMEACTIDFFEHPQRCSGKCQSRNYVNTPIEREVVLQMRRAKRNSEHHYLRREICKEIDRDINGGSSGSGGGQGDYQNEMNGDSSTAATIPNKSNDEKDVKEEMYSDNPMPEKKGRGRPRGSTNRPRIFRRMKEDLPDEYFFDNINYQEFHRSAVEGCTPFSDIMNCLQNDPTDFWNQMHKTAVISHFCDDIIVSAINLKQSILTPEPISKYMSTMLTRAVFAFGIQANIVQRVQAIEKSVNQQQKHNEMLMSMGSGSGSLMNQENGNVIQRAEEMSSGFSSTENGNMQSISNVEAGNIEQGHIFHVKQENFENMKREENCIQKF